MKFLYFLLFITFAYAEEVEKVVILGGGAAGSSAAIFAGQAGLNPLVVVDSDCNAQMALIHNIDNYPGILEPTDGAVLLNNFRKQAEGFGARYVKDSVIAIDLGQRPFKLEFTNGTTVYTDALIVATGSVKRWLELSSEQSLRGKGVIAATFCKDIDYTNKKVLVIGGGHAALQEALYIAPQASEITIINRSDKFNASKFHQQEVFETENIHILYDTEIIDFQDITQDKLTGVIARHLTTEEETYHPADIVIVAIGSTPNSILFKDQLELNAAGNIVIEGNNTATSVPGVFAAGDVTNVSYGRVVIAAGTGAMAALDVVRYLSQK